MKLEFSRQISNKSSEAQISNSIKIRPVGAELFHVDGRTDMSKLTVALRTVISFMLFSLFDVYVNENKQTFYAEIDTKVRDSNVRRGFIGPN